MNSKQTAVVLTGLLLWLVAGGAWALPNDNQQPISIQADRAVQQTLEHGEKTEYFGEVIMRQGSMQVKADHLVIHSVDRQVTRIHATGKPAEFQQQSSADKPPVVARANDIEYQLKTERLILKDSASISQPEASFSGNHIEYNVATEEVIARDRVNMVFTPTGSDTPSSQPEDHHGDPDSP